MLGIVDSGKLDVDRTSAKDHNLPFDDDDSDITELHVHCTLTEAYQRVARLPASLDTLRPRVA